MQLIDKEATLKLLQEHRDNEVSTGVIGDGIKAGYDAAMIVISNYATVIEERKHGHWELTENTISCPFCDYWNLRKKEQRNGVYVYSKTPNYCPNCGAEMESTK